MNDYVVLVTSIIGKEGDVVSLPDNSQTKERLAKKLIVPVYESEPVKPTEVKVIKPRVKKAKK